MGRGRTRSNCAAAPMSRAPATSASISIVGESAVAAGVRRIEARTRDAARRRLNEEARALADLAALLRAPVGEAAAGSKR